MERGIGTFEWLIKIIIFILIWGNKESTTTLTTRKTVIQSTPAIMPPILSPTPKRSWSRWPTRLKNSKLITTTITTTNTSNTAGPSILTPISAYSHSKSSTPWTQNTWEKKIKDCSTHQDPESSHTSSTEPSSSPLPSTPTPYGATSEPRPSSVLQSSFPSLLSSEPTFSSNTLPTTCGSWLWPLLERAWCRITRISSDRSFWLMSWSPPSDCPLNSRASDHSIQIMMEIY